MSALGHKQTFAAQNEPCPLYPRKRTFVGETNIALDHIGRAAVRKLGDLRQNNQYYRHCNCAADARRNLGKGHELHPIARR